MPLFKDVATIYSKRLCTACANRKRAEAIRQSKIENSRVEAEKMNHAAAVDQEHVIVATDESGKEAVKAEAPVGELDQSIADGQDSSNIKADEDRAHSD